MLQLEQCRGFEEFITYFVLCDMDFSLSYGAKEQFKKILSFSKEAQKMNDEIRACLRWGNRKKLLSRLKHDLSLKDVVIYPIKRREHVVKARRRIGKKAQGKRLFIRFLLQYIRVYERINVKEINYQAYS